MHIASSYSLNHFSPLCPADWRWQWACAFVESGRPRPRNLDAAAIAALRLARHLQPRNNGHFQVMDEPSRELAAFHVYKDDPQQRDLLEMYLLAGETDDAIGQRLGREPPVIGAYEELFFNVRDRLVARDWMVFVACDWPVDPCEPRALASVIRLMAYIGGPLLLDAVLVALGLATELSAGHPLCVVDERLADKIRLLTDLLTHPPRGVLAVRMLSQLQEINSRSLQPASGCLRQLQLDAIACALDQVNWDQMPVSDADAMNEPAIATVA